MIVSFRVMLSIATAFTLGTLAGTLVKAIRALDPAAGAFLSFWLFFIGISAYVIKASFLAERKHELHLATLGGDDPRHESQGLRITY